MTEYDIDPSTGLPRLPESDLFFRVNKEGVEVRRSLPDTEWSSNRPRGAVECRPAVRVIKQTRKRFLRSPVEFDIEENYTEYRNVDRSHRESIGHLEVEGQELEYDYVYGRYHVYNAQRVTRENVVEIAQIALNLYSKPFA